jgi:hypothetical protein
LTFSTRADAFLSALPVFATEVNATANAMNLNATNGSSTNNAIAIAITASVLFNAASTGKSWLGGMYLVVADGAAPATNSMYCQVISYSGANLTVKVISITGSGTPASWLISQTGPAPVEIPSGTRMPFAQAAAPVGWVQDTTSNADNRMLRVVNTTGGGVAGSDSPILNNVVTSHTHTVTTGNESATHYHTATDSGHYHTSNDGIILVANGSVSGVASSATQTGTSYAAITVSNNIGSHTHSGTTATPAGAANWTPRYIDMIICAKS